MAHEFSVIDVSNWPVVVDEQLGANEKIWLRDPAVPDTPTSRWLFKPVTVHANGSLQGGDWSEKLVGELAITLGIPSARIEIAERQGRRGSLSRNVRPSKEWDMYDGGLWLATETNAEYSRTQRCEGKNRGANKGHSLEVLHDALRDLSSPPDSRLPFSSWNGMEVFSTYLFLDALVANRDRHEQNWAVLRPVLSGGEVALAPAYDHESSLGFNLSDVRREAILARPDGIIDFARKGTAWRFDWRGRPVPSLVHAASEAARLVDSRVGTFLHAALELLDRTLIGSLVQQIPGMSDLMRRFCLELIMANAERLRNEFREYE